MVNFNLGKSKPLATLIDDEEQQNLPYTEVMLESTSKDDSTSDATSNSPTPTASSGVVEKPKIVRRLTEVSRKYDRDGKGYLNETEQALRRMDSKNKGFLEQDKVFVIMDNLLTEQKKSSELIDTIRAEQKKNIGLKRGLIGVGCFAVLLAIANIGTSFVAVSLVKDMKVENNDLTTMDGQRVATTSKVPEFSFDVPANTDLESRRRHLQAAQQVACRDVGSSSNCTLMGVFNFQKSIKIYQELCDAWQPNPTPNFAGSTCQGGGADKVLLNCKGVRSTILGGIYLPAKGPSLVDDGVWPYWAFPNEFGTYTVKEPVWFANETQRTSLNSCLLTYDLSVYCPPDGTECAAFGTYDLNICPDKHPDICNFDG